MATTQRINPLRFGTIMRGLADQSASGSFSNTRRSRRFEAFAAIVEDLLAKQDRPLRILDIGGTNSFWENRGWAGREDVEIVLVNLWAENKVHANIDGVAGDATNLSEFADGSFDVVFSNSVIEHLQTRDNQAAMAAEVRRLAPVYWIQTPNFWFPVEPHFLTPAWHWLPVSRARGAAAPAPLRLARAVPRPGRRQRGRARDPADARQRDRPDVPGGEPQSREDRAAREVVRGRAHLIRATRFPAPPKARASGPFALLSNCPSARTGPTARSGSGSCTHRSGTSA